MQRQTALGLSMIGLVTGATVAAVRHQPRSVRRRPVTSERFSGTATRQERPEE
jgi:hypothetical protein